MTERPDVAAPPSDAAPVAWPLPMQRLHDVLMAAEPFIQFEEPDVSAVALRSEIVSLAGLLANRLAAHPEDAPGGPWVTSGEDHPDHYACSVLIPNKRSVGYFTQAEATAVRDALNRLKGDEE